MAREEQASKKEGTSDRKTTKEKEGAYYARTILTKSFVSSIPSTPASLLEPELMAR